MNIDNSNRMINYFKQSGVGKMKLCPKCFALYENEEVPCDQCYCIECYGDCEDVELVDYVNYIDSKTSEDIVCRRKVIEGLPIRESTKKIILRRIDKILNGLSKD